MKKFSLHILTLLLISNLCSAQNGILVFQSDFGLRDGAVSAMKGVAMGEAPQLKIFDITHEIPPYNTWEAGYRLLQTASYWPAATVFVSVVDPGVGSERKSIVLQTKSGHFFVGPDNGQFTLIADQLGVAEVREIDEVANRRKNSQESYTFHGRDVYAYTGARLASRKITLGGVGKLVKEGIVRFNYQKAKLNGDMILGNIPVLDIQYGNLWTNIGPALLDSLQIKPGDELQVEIRNADSIIYQGFISYVHTFSDVPAGTALAYLNSLLQLSFAINQGDFAKQNNISSGESWSVFVRKNPQ